MISPYVTSAGDPVDAAPIVTGFGPMPPGRLVERENGLNGWLLWLTTGGECVIFTEGNCHSSHTGELILVKPRVRQHYGSGAASDWDCWWTVFHPRNEWLPLLNWPQLAPGYLRLTPASATATETYFRLAHETANGAHPQRAEMAMCYLELLLRDSAASNPLLQSELDSRVLTAMNYMCRHLEQSSRGVTLEQVARAAGISVPHLCRLFAAQVGVSPLRYLEQRRLERAAELLRVSALRVGEIAGASGFSDPLYFSARFRKEMGLSPQAYARLARQTGRGVPQTSNRVTSARNKR